MSRRFKAGDLAVIVVGNGERTAALLGEIVEIVAVGISAGQEIRNRAACYDADYAALGPAGERLLAMDWQLAPLERGEPASLIRETEQPCEVAA